MAESTREEPVPDVLTMVLCDGIHHDNGKFYIMGTYSALLCPQFPAPIQVICFLELTDGRGETKLTMRLVDVDQDGEPVFVSENVCRFSDPTEVRQIVFAMIGAIVPRPGEYRLQLFGNQRFMRERRLIIMPIPQPPFSQPDGGPPA